MTPDHDGMHDDHSGSAVVSGAAPDWLVESLDGGIMADGTVMSLGVGHNGHADASMGSLMNVHDLYGAAVDMGLDADTFIREFSSDLDHFNDPRHVDWWYPAATLAVMNDLTAAVTMGGLEGDTRTLELIQGAATQAALAGDGAEVRKVLVAAGGDPSALTDDQLVTVWGTNSHHYNHNALKVHAEDGSNHGFKLTHLRSLNDHAMDGTEPGTRGGYNDRGEYRERPQGNEDGFYDYARAFLDEVSDVLPGGYEASGSLEARNGGTFDVDSLPDVAAPAPEPIEVPEGSAPPAVEFPEPEDPPAEPEPAPSDDGLAAEFVVRNDWGNGGTIDLVLTNTSDSAVSDWTVTFELDPDITEGWNVELSNLIGAGRTTASDAGEGWQIAPGQSVSWAGFNVNQGDLDEAALNAAANFDALVLG